MSPRYNITAYATTRLCKSSKMIAPISITRRQLALLLLSILLTLDHCPSTSNSQQIFHQQHASHQHSISQFDHQQAHQQQQPTRRSNKQAIDSSRFAHVSARHSGLVESPTTISNHEHDYYLRLHNDLIGQPSSNAAAKLMRPHDGNHLAPTQPNVKPSTSTQAIETGAPLTIDASSPDFVHDNYDWLFKMHQLDLAASNSTTTQVASLQPTNSNMTQQQATTAPSSSTTSTTTEQSNNILQPNLVNERPSLMEPGLSDLSLASTQATPTQQTTDFFFSSAERFPVQDPQRAPNAWWALGFGQQFEIAQNLTSDDYLDYCAKSDLLVTNKQRALCRSHWKVMQIVARGLRLAIEECQFRFANNRWNCSLGAAIKIQHNPTESTDQMDSSMLDLHQQANFNNHIQSPNFKSLAAAQVAPPKQPATIFGDVMRYPNRERSFLNAIVAAGLAHAMTKACSAGELPEECSCDKKIRSRNNRGKIEWVACSDDIDFGSRFSRDFTDDTELAQLSTGSPNSIDSTANQLSNPMINTHNYEVGRRVFKSATDITCTCQSTAAASPGLSTSGELAALSPGGGLCATKRCWKHLAPFSDIGDELMKRYERATHVQPSNKDPHKLRPVRRGVRRPKRKDLVFIDESPNYCDSDTRLGIVGTQGRHCNSTSAGPDSCSILCCGRGYQLVTEKVEEKCNCQFVYCCRIVCDKCERHVSYDVCN